MASCGGEAPHDGPVVFITFDSLRADVVGGLGGEKGLTPHLDALLRDASWSGRAIASSSSGPPSMASLLTGLRPWQHQVITEGRRLPSELVTLPEAMRAAGYQTAAFPGEPTVIKALGFDQGLDLLGSLSKGSEAANRLRRLGGGREFVWIHIPEPQAPYFRRPKLAARLNAGKLDLPARVLPHHLAPFFDPAVPLPPRERQRFWAMYRLNVAWADERLGRLVEALRASGRWEGTLLVVTSTHGEEFGEKGQILSGGNLGRQLLEVPLAVKLPAGFGRKIAAPAGQRVATARLWATLVEAVGGEAPPAVAPSLFQEAPAAVLSELYLGNGANQLSLVEGDYQLLWESRFAPPQPEYYRARLALMARGNARIARARISEPPRRILARLEEAFRATPPLSGRAAPRLTLERWEGEKGSGARQVSDPDRMAAMARLLSRTWSSFLPGEESPEAEAREWYTAESP